MREYKVDYEGIGFNIRSRRIEKGLSQESLAKNIGISKAYMSQIESGKKHPALEVCIAIANDLDMSMDEMLCGNLKQSKYIYEDRFASLFEDCDPVELQLMESLIRDTKKSVKRYKKHLQVKQPKYRKLS